MKVPKVKTFPFVDYGAPKNVGEPLHVDMSIVLACVKEYMKADEVESALWILNNLPSYYKDNPPKEFIDLRRKIFEQTLTTQDYAFGEGCKSSTKDIYAYYQNPSQYRFKVVADKVRELNSQGITPHIVELGPGEGWLAMGMIRDGLKFTYYPLVLNPEILSRLKIYYGEVIQDDIKDAYEIYVCMETAEHLWSPQEIYHYYARYQVNAQYLVFSTPKYTCFGGIPDWEDKPIGHIRAWSPTEFHKFLNQYFIGYQWKHIDGPLMVFTGEQK